MFLNLTRSVSLSDFSSIQHKFKITGDCCSFKLFRRSAGGKHFMRVESETSAFKFLCLCRNKEYEHIDNYYFIFYLPLNRRIKNRQVQVWHLRSEVGLFCVSTSTIIKSVTSLTHRTN